VLATGGDTYLGGEDFDQLIINWLVEEFQKENGIDLRGDRMALQRLKEAAEKAKCELSTQPQAEIVLPFISANQSGPKHLNTVLTRTKFEQMIQPLLDRTVKPCEDALKEAGLSKDELDEVIPVGGQTRTPKVLETIKKIFAKEPNRSVNPDEVVSIGAAIQTGILQGEVTDLVLLDVTPHTLGIETKDGTFTPLIERNSNIPTKKSRIFTTVTDNQTKVEVHVLQGEGTTAHENTSLGKFMLTDVAPAPKGVPQIEVTFEIDVNGIVQVTALDQATGRQQNITVRAASGLTQSEVEKARTEADKQAKREEGMRQREKVTAQLQGLIQSTRKTYELLQSKLTDQERSQATAALSRAEQTREGSIEDLQAALATLETTAEALGQAMMRG
jgi:molecular chaperone DnaK